MVLLISVIAMNVDRYHQRPTHHKETLMFYFVEHD